MEHVNPYRVMRNEESLEAYRSRLRAAGRQAQPFVWIAVCFDSVALFLFAAGLLGQPSKLSLGVLYSLLAAGGLSLFVGQWRSRQYLKRHPLPPELRLF